MATNTPTSRSAGVVNCSAGSFTSDGTACVVTLGFAARRVEVYNETDTIAWAWQEGMAATKSKKVVAAGTMTTDTGTAILAAAGGKTMTLSATLCGTAKVITYTAWG